MISEKINEVKQWFSFHKNPPKRKAVLGALDLITDDNIHVGDEIVIENSQLVKIVDKCVAPLSWDILVEYSNGALRWINTKEHSLFLNRG